jgi:hypothetical protein
LTNPITRPKDADTLVFFQNVESALEKGKNPFAHISKQAREKLMAMIK